MNGLDVYERYKAAEKQIKRKEEQIARRRALAEGCTSRPLSPDGGIRGSSDASMRLVDFMADVEKVQAEIDEIRAQRVRDKACCLYLAEMLPDNYGELLIRRYINGDSVQECAAGMAYSVTHTRRLLREAEGMCRCIELVAWDGSHIPIVAIVGEGAEKQPSTPKNEPNGQNMVGDGS